MNINELARELLLDARYEASTEPDEDQVTRSDYVGSDGHHPDCDCEHCAADRELF